MEETLEGGRGPPRAVMPLERERERERESSAKGEEKEVLQMILLIILHFFPRNR